MRVEPATEPDLPAIEALLGASGLPLDGVREAFATGVGVVAREGGVLAGCAAVEPYGEAGLLRSVAVRAGLRRRGIGRALVAAAETLAVERGIRELHLLTQTAAAWFELLGYAPIDRSAVPLAVVTSVELTLACPSTAVVLRRRLEPAQVARVGHPKLDK